jgi:hypothetical protein
VELADRRVEAPRMAICGKIVIESIRYITNERPWKWKRPSA